MGIFEWSLLGLMLLGIITPLVGAFVRWRLPHLSFKPSMSDAPLLWFDPHKTLRKELRALRLRRLPRAALDDIVDNKIAAAQRLSRTGLSAYSNPKAFES